MLTGPKVNSAMGLQATTATKRKHDLTFDCKDTNTYTNCAPPIKSSKWSLNNNNYIDAAEEQKITAVNGYKTNNNSNTNINNNNNNENKTCDISCGTISYNLRNGKEVPAIRSKITSTKPVLNTIVANIPAVGEVDATTPLPPTSTTSLPDDSIAKLEVVASVPWTSAPETVDCISKLQAVAVPSDPWGSISTRSTLATTLLSADELDDDDDDFEDDYEEEESIIPTYCPLRYHTFPSANPSSPSSSPSNLQNQRMGSSFTNSQTYNSRPNYYSEPFPQQNCSRTGSPQHLRVGNGFSWPNGNSNSFYANQETPYTSSQQQQQQNSSQQHQPQVQQQTIRCAENGKSYLELGCSSPVSNVASNTIPVSSSTTQFSGLHVVAPPAHEARLPLKRCCDARGVWCGANKSCYKDIRLKIRNLSMFKLSRFRQVSEQSLYRSVLICNTLKRIDKEIESETKELHQAAAHVTQNNQLHHNSAHQPPQLQYHHHLHSHIQIQSPLSLHSNTSNGQQQSISQQQHHTQQPMLHPQHQDYMPVPNCGRLGGNIEYQNHQLQQQSTAQQAFQQHHHYQNERIESSQFQNTLQKPSQNTSQFINNQTSNSCTGSITTTLHPYDHYPFRESHSGRATPFPNQAVISLPPASSTAAASSPTSQAELSGTSPATSTTPATTTTPTTSDTDSGYADDDSTRSINWSSVLSLSSQSALDPLNNNDLFSILPPANPATAVPVSIPSTSSRTNGSETNSISSMAMSISGTFTTVQSSSSASSSSATSSLSNSTIPPSATTTPTFTTLSTISSATHSLTSSYVSSMSSNSSSTPSTWEYGFLDMEFGLGTEFTELAPSCKLSMDDFGFKNSITPVTVTRYDSELEQPAHIMVGS
ncbi:SERTA domain-containing protein 2 taranis isoform 1-T1 [Cochliomyia hominivorax]